MRVLSVGEGLTFSAWDIWDYRGERCIVKVWFDLVNSGKEEERRQYIAIEDLRSFTQAGNSKTIKEKIYLCDYIHCIIILHAKDVANNIKT